MTRTFLPCMNPVIAHRLQGAFAGALIVALFSWYSHRDISRLDDFIETVQHFHAVQMSKSELVDKAMHGLLSNLDKYSELYASEEDLQNDIQEKYVGIGASLLPQKDSIQVAKIYPDSPAARAGLKPGDLLQRVDDLPVKGLDLESVVQRVQGEHGTTVRLLWVHHGRLMSGTLRRETIVPSTVETRWVEQDQQGATRSIMLVKISHFTRRTTRELIDQLNDATAIPKALILDLRGNPGGVMDAAVDIASLFLPAGTGITQLRYRDHTEAFVAQAPKATAARINLQTLPLVVLVDHDSASATELLSAALAENGRAILIGSRTYGKGSVQGVFPVNSLSVFMPSDDQRVFKFTTAHYLTPKGHKVNGEGIVPEVVVEPGMVPSTNLPRKNGSSRLTIPDDVALKRAISQIRANLVSARKS